MSKRGNAEWEIYKTLESIVALTNDTIKDKERVGEWSYLLPIRCKVLSGWMRGAADQLERYYNQSEKGWKE